MYPGFVPYLTEEGLELFCMEDYMGTIDTPCQVKVFPIDS